MAIIVVIWMYNICRRLHKSQNGNLSIYTIQYFIVCFNMSMKNSPPRSEKDYLGFYSCNLGFIQAFYQQHLSWKGKNKKHAPRKGGGGAGTRS